MKPNPLTTGPNRAPARAMLKAAGFSETIVVTAAMPITTPSTVSPARSLFFRSALAAIRRVRKKFI